MSRNLPTAILRFLARLARRQVTRALDDATLRDLADALTDLGQEELAARLEAFFASEDRRAALEKALAQADACARARLQDTPWQEMAGERGLPLRGLPSLLPALEALPQDDLDETRLHAALAQALQRDWRATPEQARSLADLYLACLRAALLEVGTDALRTLGRSVLRTEAAVQRLEQALQVWRVAQSRALEDAVAGLHQHLDAMQDDLAALRQGQREILHRLPQTRPARAAVPSQAPPLPPYFVRRDEVAEPLLRDLLAEGAQAPGVLVVSAIHGLGSVGKSTLAAYLAHQDAVRQRFPDGVLWATLGQEPDLLKLLTNWIRALGEDYTPLSVEEATTYLRSMLRDRAALLVVDDAWRPEHVRPFLAGGPKCRVLVTTREADIARAVGAQLYELDVLTPQQAMELLRKRLGRELTGAEGQAAAALAREVGYLPLALELAAAQVEDGVPWAEVLDDLRAEIARLETLERPLAWEPDLPPAERKRLSLRASFNLSLRRLRRPLLEAFAWLGVLPEDVLITPAMTATLWAVDVREARRRLRLLRNKALLLAGSQPRGEQAYRLHDLLHDLARRLLTAPPQPTQEGDLPGLGLTLPSAHRRVLARYRARTHNGLWHTLPDDGYIHQHLTWHMDKAGDEEALIALFQEETAPRGHGWYTALDRLGRTDLFMQDLERLWRLADQRRDIGLQVRWALIKASLHSLAANLPAELPALLVENDLWTPAQALAHLRQMPDERKRARALAALAPVLARKAPQALAEALQAARSIEDDFWRAHVLAALAPHLPPEQRRQALHEALQAARSIEDADDRAQALAALAPHLPSHLLPQALQVVQSIRWADNRAKVLAALAPRLAEAGFPEQALQAARSIEDADDRAQALAALAPHLPPEQRRQALHEALQAARSIKSDRYRAEALAALAPHLSSHLLPDALQAAQSIRYTVARAQALAALAPKLPPEQRSQALQAALQAARRIGDANARTQALAALAPKLPPEQRSQALQAALQAARRIGDANARTQALAALVPHLPPDLFPQALQAAQSIESDWRRAEALAALAPHLSPEQRRQALHEALQAAHSIGDTYARAEALAALVPHLPPDLLPQALQAAQSIESDWRRAEALAALAPHLPPDLFPQALQAARSIEDEDARAQILAALAPKLAEAGFPEQALQAAQSIENDRYRTEALVTLAPYLPPDLLPQALQAAQSIENDRYRTEALVTLAPYLPPDLLPQALQAARRIGDANARAQALAALAPRLAEAGFPEQALQAAQSIESDRDGARALAALAPHLPPELRHQALQDALQAARGLPEQGLFGSPRAEALAALAPHLPPELRHQALQDALQAARGLPEQGLFGSPRAEALAALAPHLPPELRHQALQDALQAAQSIESDRYRAQILAALAPKLAEARLPDKALQAAQSIKWADDHTEALVALAPKLAEAGLPDKALQAARSIRWTDDRAKALAALAPHLPQHLRCQALADALQAAQNVEWPLARAEALAALAPKLAEIPRERLYPLWRETLPLLAARTREHLLADLPALAPIIQALGGPEAVAETFRAIQDVGRWWP